MKPGERFRFMCRASPLVGALVEIVDDRPGYSVALDEFRDDFANIRVLEGHRAGLVSACDKAYLVRAP